MKYAIKEDETVTIDGHKLNRIVATEAFGGIKPGDLGGFIEDYYNLSREDNCWIHKDSYVYDSARVSGNGDVINSTLCEKALLLDNATVVNSYISGQATISGRSIVSNSKVKDSALIKDAADIDQNSVICGNAIVTGSACVKDSTISGTASISGEAYLYRATVMGNTLVRDKCYIESARLYSGQYLGKTLIKRNVIIRMPVIIKDGKIQNENDIFSVYAGFTKGNLLTIYKANTGRLAFVLDGEYSSSKAKLQEYVNGVDEGFFDFIEKVTNASFEE